MQIDKLNKYINSFIGNNNFSVSKINVSRVTNKVAFPKKLQKRVKSYLTRSKVK